jgi:excisionase family DNA binding protein
MSDTRLRGSKVLLSRKEASALTGISLRTIAKLLAARELGSIRVGRRRLIPYSALERFAKVDYSTVEADSAHRKAVGR